MSGPAAAIAQQLVVDDAETRRLAAKGLAGLDANEAPGLLLKALADTDWRVRKEAASAAPRVGRRVEVVAALVSALHERDDIGLRNAAVEALVAIGDDAVEPTIAALRALDADGRKLGVEVLAGVVGARSVAALCLALDDDDANVRVAAAEGLGRATDAGGPSRDAAIRALVTALGGADDYVKLGALDALNRLEASLPWSVCEPLASHPLLRRHAMAILARSGEPGAVAALARSVADPSATVAREAVVALGDTIEQKSDDAELMGVARDTLRPSQVAQERVRAFAHREDDPKARGAALAALGLVQDPDDVPLLVEALGDDEVAERAELGLQLYGESAVGPLLDASRTAPPPARSASISIAPMLSPGGDRDVVEALRAALTDGSPDVASAALSSLGRAGEAADLPRVARFVKSSDARVAHAAGEAVVALAERHAGPARGMMTALDPSGDDAIVGSYLLRAVGDRGRSEDMAFLRAALAHGDARARREAATTLGALGGDSAANAVTLALTDEERDVVLAAMRALARMGLEEETLAGVIPGLLDHEAWEVRRLAAELLGRSSSPEAIERLRARLRVEPEPMVRAVLGAWVGTDE
jgi:HEAT repeat protein